LLPEHAQGEFWPYHEKLMASQGLNDTVYKAIADEVGLARDSFDACMESADVAALIDRDVAEGSAVGVHSTPAFFVNGRLIKGANPLADFKELIDAELARDSGG
jgi:protein-disulfide isomerase